MNWPGLHVGVAWRAWMPAEAIPAKTAMAVVVMVMKCILKGLGYRDGFLSLSVCC